MVALRDLCLAQAFMFGFIKEVRQGLSFSVQRKYSDQQIRTQTWLHREVSFMVWVIWHIIFHYWNLIQRCFFLYSPPSLWGTQYSVCRVLYCVFRTFSSFFLWAVTYPTRKDHCFSLTLLIIFMHMNKMSWLKSCWAGLISSAQWRIKTPKTERKIIYCPMQLPLSKYYWG